MCIDLLPEKLLQAIKKKKKNDMNRTPLPHWYHSYCSVMQRFLKVTTHFNL